MPCQLRLPTVEEPVASYWVSDFCKTILAIKPGSASGQTILDASEECQEGNAVLKSFEMIQAESWADWHHKSLVFTIVYNDQEYIIHISRGWNDNNCYWWQSYVPLIGFQSTKPPNDEVYIFLLGEEEQNWRDKTWVVVRAEFADDGGVVLPDLAKILYDINVASLDYSLFGINCWAWAHATLAMALNRFRTHIKQGGLQHRARPGAPFINREVDSFSRDFLGDHWANLEFLAQDVQKARGPMTLTTFSWPIAYLRKLFKPPTLRWETTRLIMIWSENAIDLLQNGHTRSYRSTDEEPPPTVTFSEGGREFQRKTNFPLRNGFLYLLTPQISWSANSRLVRVSLLAFGEQQDLSLRSDFKGDEEYIKRAKQPEYNPKTWFEASVIRLNAAGDLEEISPRFEFGRNDRVQRGAFSVTKDMDENSALVESVRKGGNGSMIAVWVRVEDRVWASYMAAARVQLEFRKNGGNIVSRWLVGMSRATLLLLVSLSGLLISTLWFQS